MTDSRINIIIAHNKRLIAWPSSLAAIVHVLCVRYMDMDKLRKRSINSLVVAVAAAAVIIVVVVVVVVAAAAAVVVYTY